MAENTMLREWEGEELKPKTVFDGEEEVFGASVLAQCPDKGEVAIHVAPGENVISSVYMTPDEAERFADQIKFAAWAARILEAADAS